MFSTKDPVVKFERKPAPQGTANRTFITLLAGVVVGVFATVMLWPSSPRMFTPAPAAASDYVPPTMTRLDATQQGAGAMFICTVTSVYDGDGPIHCREGQSIRLHAIAAREMDETCRKGHPCPDATGAAAKRELQSLALGHVLACEQTGTSYNRVTAVCWTEQKLELNCAMVRSGNAVIWDRYNREHRICS